jgi:hypothetical protein
MRYGILTPVVAPLNVYDTMTGAIDLEKENKSAGVVVVVNKKIRI